ncbi:CRISPR-associated endonuclease Cas1 [Paludibaculum fermentans]|uniref:CRISPR-associated endonuclease Cas1 n=1 Tax=Paludibaculum fermentans TaxID=1473598 RepID=UPI003EB6D159
MEALHQELSSGTWRPLPLLPLVAEKRPNSPATRTFHIPAVRDRIVQTALARRLSRAFEAEFLDSSFAYRRGRGVDRAIARVAQWRDRGCRAGVDGDIASFFDNVPHRLLLEHLRPEVEEPGVYEMVARSVRAWVWNGDRVRRLTRGIGQGSPLSPVLANFFLHPLDVELEKSGCRVVRYADDFLVLAESAESALQAAERAAAVLDQLGLKLNVDKTQLVNFERGFNYLGAWFVGERVYLPWRMGPKPKGRIVKAAPPMPARLLHQWRQKRPGKTEPEAPVIKQSATGPPGDNRLPATKGSAFMAYLYVSEQGSIIRKSGERLMVEHDSHVALDLPYHKLENVLVFGNVQVTSQAMLEMLDKGISLSLFTRHGRFRGALAGAECRNVPLRLAQYDFHRDSDRSLEAARATIAAKIGNGLWVLERYRSRHPDVDLGTTGLTAIEDALTHAKTAESVSALLGVEGSAARAYFDSFMRFNLSGFPWLGRRKHPSTDPINALLSFTYSLLTEELRGLLEASGLDPGVGFLHEPEYGRPSLALDLVEPLRHPVADRFVMSILNRHEFKAEDFEQHGGPAQPVYLTTEAIRQFFQHYEKWMSGKDEEDSGAGAGGYRALLRRECRRAAACVRDGISWAPYRCGEEILPEDPWNTSSVTI